MTKFWPVRQLETFVMKFLGKIFLPGEKDKASQREHLSLCLLFPAPGYDCDAWSYGNHLAAMRQQA